MDKSKLLALLVLIFLVLRVFAEEQGGEDGKKLQVETTLLFGGHKDIINNMIKINTMAVTDNMVMNNNKALSDNMATNNNISTNNNMAKIIPEDSMEKGLSRRKRFALAGYLGFLFLLVNTGRAPLSENL
jgi:hypothetical protein